MASSVVADEPLVRVAFNREATHLVAATSSGIRVFSCNPFEHVFSRSGFASPDGGGEVITSADLGPSSSLVAVVFGDTIRYWNEAHGQMMSADLSPSTHGAVRAVRHVGGRVLVAGEDRVALHEISKDGVKQIMEVETGPNPQGACALAQADDDGQGFVLACPTPTIGEVQVWHGSNNGARRVDVRAHINGSVGCLELSGDGRLLATSSTGTVIRIFSTTDGLTLQELIRGSARAEIYSMVFSPDYRWLAVCSDNAAVDMFSVKVDLSSSTPADDPEADDATYVVSPHTYASVVARFTAKYPVAELWLDQGVRRMAGFGQEPNTILVAGLDGSFYRCQFDPLKAQMKQIEHKNFMKME
ncbi:unnamed protein product [Urochloa humidicola]